LEDNFQEDAYSHDSHKTSSQEDEMEFVCLCLLSLQKKLLIQQSLRLKNLRTGLKNQMEEHGAAANPAPAAGSSNRGAETSDLADSE
jgi:hypothetical protein